jgi:hypothetical protein
VRQLIAYCFGGALRRAVIFFPITYLAMKSSVRLQGLAQAWKPFGYSVVLLAIEEFVEIALKTAPTMTTAIRFVDSLVIPIAICAGALYITGRDRTPSPNSCSS